MLMCLDIKSGLADPGPRSGQLENPRDCRCGTGNASVVALAVKAGVGISEPPLTYKAFLWM
jgi:hypothetical protein